MSRPSSNPETLRAAEAFELWFWLPLRSMEEVARRFHVSSRIVRVWAAKFNWDVRAAEREEKIKASIANQADAEAVAAQLKMVRIADATLSRYAARLLKDEAARTGQGVTQFEPTASDAARWAQLRLLLTGQATSRNEVTVGAGFADALLATVSAVLRREVPRCCPSCKTDLGLSERIGAALLEASAKLAAETSGERAAPPAPQRLGHAADDAPDAAGPGGA